LLVLNGDTTENQRTVVLARSIEYFKLFRNCF